jgi:hypothetical protein
VKALEVRGTRNEKCPAHADVQTEYTRAIEIRRGVEVGIAATEIGQLLEHGTDPMQVRRAKSWHTHLIAEGGP